MNDPLLTVPLPGQIFEHDDITYFFNGEKWVVLDPTTHEEYERIIGKAP